ncbi:hypothetical protein, variant [Phytophthora nicotianae INRA-310]|uniref:Uncharacterized protein n=1 Tax=Phytophthora nicotianae (strain INRA-310) TaxID=761204 RepID=W2PB02_PHYN3|nr:hypothetical protein PPTG_20020 [Phytophthora nicotianae INRA-310]XP_008916874.1 hypothetical protein, variant [Phytophthora nicotianae INRA-310]ETM97825.1 hypothetical protein PPTG_20020 [Phytophthora nicotianae INRA-310]ETM97826.1 hypothetical protein, variant [Phytophthora nicotianae INRA-310]
MNRRWYIYRSALTMVDGFLPKKQATHPMVVPSPLGEGRQTQTE